MNWENIIYYAIVPILVAVIGGLITLIGVKKTISASDKNGEKKTKQQYKPLFFIVGPQEPFGGYDSCFVFSSKENKNSKKHLEGNFVNTSKAIFIIKNILINETMYCSKYGEITIEEKQKFNLYIEVDAELFQKAELNIVLNITDALGNNYYYKLKRDEDFPDCFSCCEEIKN